MLYDNKSTPQAQVKNSFQHILVVDDDDRIRDLLCLYLKDNGYFVSSAIDTEQARDLLQEYVFDIIILDVMLPGQTGIEFTEEFRKLESTPIIILTAMGDSENRILGLEVGADDYLAKPFEPRELLLRIKKIIDRTSTADRGENKLLSFGGLQFDPKTEQLARGDEVIFLTSAETKLLAILAARCNNVVSREELASLFGGVNDRSIDVQVIRLRNKIESDPKKPIFLKTIRGEGYILRL